MRRWRPVMSPEESDLTPIGVNLGQTDFSALNDEEAFRLVSAAEEGLPQEQRNSTCQSRYSVRHPCRSVHGILIQMPKGQNAISVAFT